LNEHVTVHNQLTVICSVPPG